jgi:uncharacterized protein (TIGR00369 family)
MSVGQDSPEQVVTGPNATGSNGIGPNGTGPGGAPADHAPASWGDARQKTVTWYDHQVGLAAMPTMTGLEYMRAMQDGTLPPPPISALMGMELISVDQGEVVFGCTPDASAYNPIGVIHGGLVCTLLDSVVGCAVHTTLPAGTGYTSLEIKVSYLRAVHADGGSLRATGRVTKPGKRAAFAEGEVHDAQGRLVATTTSTFLVFPL